MVAANPKSALAYVNRYRYNHEFGLPADKNDIARALELGPDEAEVLITAAELAREGNDLAAARKHVEHGLQKHPANPVFYRMSAGFDLAENHPDRAEAILRQGIAAVPSNVELKILLTEALISQEKVDGEEGAASWIERLRKLGLADGYAYYLEARVAMVKQQWPQAISKFDLARSLLAADPAIVSRINLMLAECHSRTGESEKRVAALKRAASGETTAAVAGPLLAQTMESEGRLDEAIRDAYGAAGNPTRVAARSGPAADPEDSPRAARPASLAASRARAPRGGKGSPRASRELTLLRAELLAAEGRRDEAQQTLEAAVRREPGQVSYRAALARLILGQPQDGMAARKRPSRS